jgi:hypothetical protein
MAMGEAETGASETVQFCVLMVAAVALGAEMQFRPQLFTFIFFAATLWILARDNYGRRPPLWLIAVAPTPPDRAGTERGCRGPDLEYPHGCRSVSDGEDRRG